MKLKVAIILLISLVMVIKINATLNCFGKSNLESLVCSGNGNCVGNDNCTCNIGYFGSNCEVSAPSYNISTIAGTGTAGYGANSGVATQLMLSAPQGVAVTKNGEVYIADSTNNVIRKVYLNGTMEVIAGTTQGYSGDNGLAINCQFFSPQGVSLDPTENYLFVADTLNNAVRMINLQTGIIQQYIGSGNPGYTSPGYGNAYGGWFKLIRSVAVSQTGNGEIFFSDSDNNMVRKSNPSFDLSDVCGRGQTNSYLGDGGLGINAWIGIPYQVTVNNDLDVFFADIQYGAVRKISRVTGIINRVIGGGSSFGEGGQALDAQLYGPRGIAVSPSGELFVADSGNNRMRKVFTNGIIVTIAGTSSAGYSGDDGLSLGAKLNNPVNIAIRQTRELSEIYFADAGNHAIRKLSAFCPETHTLIDGLCYPLCSGKSSLDVDVCSGRGNCSTYNQCTCSDDGYYGSNCETFNCNGVNMRNSSVCSGKGVCSSPENCTCLTGYYGTDCEFFDCFGVIGMTACSAQGKCTSFDNCTCNTGYYGQECELFNCYGVESNNSLVCSSKGSCDDFNSCNCTTGYYGEVCQKAYCHGVKEDEPSVCSGKGKCIQLDMCQCKDGFYGSNCENFTCSGIPSTNISVCSGRGICSSYNNCSCKTEGYYGSNCEKFNCFNFTSDDEKVCSKHGVCSSYNNCSCLNGYYGSQCESFTCYGISSTNTSSVCSGRGFCNSYNNCTCLKGYFGMDCKNFTCFNEDPSSASVCSGSGLCVDKDVCVCSSALGEKCQTRLSAGNRYNGTIMSVILIALFAIQLLW